MRKEGGQAEAKGPKPRVRILYLKHNEGINNKIGQNILHLITHQLDL